MTDVGPMTADEVRAAVIEAVDETAVEPGHGRSSWTLSFTEAIATRVAEKLAERVVATLPERKEFDAESCDSGDDCESSDYVDGWNDALDSISDGKKPVPQAAETTRTHATQQGAATPGQGATAQSAVPAAGNVAEPQLGPTAHRAEHPPSDFPEVAADLTDVDLMTVTATTRIHGEHAFVITATGERGLHTGRRRYRVECRSCSVLVHPATTSAQMMIKYHLRHPQDGQPTDGADMAERMAPLEARHTGDVIAIADTNAERDGAMEERDVARAEVKRSPDVTDDRPMTADEVRAVVRDVFARVAELSGMGYPYRTIEDIATRVAAKLSGRAAVALGDEDRRTLQMVRDHVAQTCGATELLDRLLVASDRNIAGCDAARLALDKVASELRASEARAMSLEQLAAVAAADARYDVTGSEDTRRFILNAVPSLIGAVRDLHDLQAKLTAILNEVTR